jgi:hypothetical protein
LKILKRLNKKLACITWACPALDFGKSFFKLLNPEEAETILGIYAGKSEFERSLIHSPENPFLLFRNKLDRWSWKE